MVKLMGDHKNLYDDYMGLADTFVKIDDEKVQEALLVLIAALEGIK